MTSTLKKITPFLILIATIKAPLLFTIFIGLGILTLVELYFIENPYVLSGHFSMLVYLIWQVAVGSILYLKAKNKPTKRFYTFLTCILIVGGVQAFLIGTKDQLVSSYQSGQTFDSDLLYTVSFLNYLNTLATFYIPYFLTIILRQHEVSETKMEWKTYVWFLFAFIGVWDLQPRIRQVLLPHHTLQRYSSGTKKIAVLLFFVYIVAFIIIASIVSWRQINKWTTNDPTQYLTETTKLSLAEERELESLVESLKTLSDDEIEQVILEFTITKVYEDDFQGRQALKRLPVGYQRVFATMILEGEVNNGGFNQYFFNDSRNYVDEAYEAYLALGLLEHAQLVKDAVDLYADEIELHNKTKNEGTIEAFMESYQVTKLGELDNIFYELPDASETRKEYIRNNYQDFVN
ncbi:MAG TPA: DUF4375 domain-containing protein [Patescibacteria group bacterium]